MFWVHSTHEIKALLVASLLLFSGFAFTIGSSWHATATHALLLPANSVGVFAGVEENEVNALATQLDARERALNAREEALLTAQSSTTDELTLLLLTLSGFGMFGLILLNFYLDGRRRMSIAPVV